MCFLTESFTFYLVFFSHTSSYNLLRRRRLRVRPQDVSTAATTTSASDVTTGHTGSSTGAFKNHLSNKVRLAEESSLLFVHMHVCICRLAAETRMFRCIRREACDKTRTFRADDRSRRNIERRK